MKYRVRYGCPKCGSQRFRALGRRPMTDFVSIYPDDSPATVALKRVRRQWYQCSDPECGHRWQVAPAKPIMEREKETADADT